MSQKVIQEEKNIQPEKQFAGFVVRFAAFAIDFIILILISIFAAIVFTVIIRLANVNWDVELVSSFMGFLLNAGYYTFMTYRYGATIGKKIFGLKVESVKDEKLDIGAVIVREIAGKFISITLAGIGYIWIIFDKKKQGFHDKLGGTVVVVDREKKVANWKVFSVSAIFAIFLVCFSFWITLGVLDEGFQDGIERDQITLLVSKTLVSAKLCVSEENDIKTPISVQDGGGDICTEKINTVWPKLFGGYEYGKINNESIVIKKDGDDIIRCEVEETTCDLIGLPE